VINALPKDHTADFVHRIEPKTHVTIFTDWIVLLPLLHSKWIELNALV